MNQMPPQGTPMGPYNPQTPPQGNLPPQQGYGTQWNAAPNFNATPGAGQPGNFPQQPPSGNKKTSGKKKKKKGGSLVGYIFLGIFLMLALAVGGGFLGYNAAISSRKVQEKKLINEYASEQYIRALSDIENGNYTIAKQRLEYVLGKVPDYPNAQEKYQEVAMALYPTASPTPMITATPMPTSTPDTRGEEEMFRAIQQSVYNQQWEAAISQIEALRDRDISYRGLEVDGLYYIALRNYGIQQINAGYLENGVYNITLAESFGPIDNNANSMRIAARSYLSGAGFWEIDWSKALEYYSNAAMSYPNLFDRATMLTANQRFAEASFKVADEYVASGDYCGALQYYNQGLPIAGNEYIQQTVTAVDLICNPPQPTAVPSSEDNSSPDYGAEDNGYEDDEDFYIAE